MTMPFVPFNAVEDGQNLSLVRIAHDTQEGARIFRQIVTLLEAHGYGPRDVGHLEMAYTEALINAVWHGNGDDPKKEVRINFQVTAHEVWIAIEDEGPGFDLRDVADPLLEENLSRPCGRGLLLMRSMLTSVEFNGRGNAVLLRKVRSPQMERGEVA